MNSINFPMQEYVSDELKEVIGTISQISEKYSLISIDGQKTCATIKSIKIRGDRCKLVLSNITFSQIAKLFKQPTHVRVTIQDNEFLFTNPSIKWNEVNQSCKISSYECKILDLNSGK